MISVQKTCVFTNPVYEHIAVETKGILPSPWSHTILLVQILKVLQWMTGPKGGFAESIVSLAVDLHTGLRCRLVARCEPLISI